MRKKKLYIAEVKRQEFLVRDEHDEKALSIILSRLKKLKLNLSSDDRWLEIGGFIGGFVVTTSSQVEHIYSFEADLDNYEVLSANKEFHLLHNVDIYIYAVINDNTKTRDFYINTKSDKSLHSFNVKKRRHNRPVNCVCINDMIQSLKVNKLLIDAGGSEVEIIECLTEESYKKIKEIGILFYPAFYKESKDNHLFYKKIVDILKRYYNNIRYNEDAYEQEYLLIHATNSIFFKG